MIAEETSALLFGARDSHSFERNILIESDTGILEEKKRPPRCYAYK
jgi:hypothetical protein